MIQEIETVEIYFPGGHRSFYRKGMAIQTPTPNPGVYTTTDMVVLEIRVSRLFRHVSIFLSNNEKIEYRGLSFSITTKGFTAELEKAVERRLRAEEEKKEAARREGLKHQTSDDSDTPSKPTTPAEPAGEVAPPVGQIEEEKI
jgi:hypothetical protein